MLQAVPFPSRETIAGNPWRPSKTTAIIFGICGGCSGGILIIHQFQRSMGARYNLSEEIFLPFLQGHRSGVLSNYPDGESRFDVNLCGIVLGTYPAMVGASCPEFVHPDIARLHEKDLRHALGNVRLTLMMCGNLVETVLKREYPLPEDSDPEARKPMLGTRIKKLVEGGTLPPTLEGLADTVRILRIPMTHEDTEGNEEDAKQALQFVTLLLELVYTVPERVRRIKKSLDANKAKAN
ncbi:MAG: DUF4145 domain-containing protein [Candidatus Methylomirabilis sp.]|nr:DUF4145 domain-containing protein [Deltaproteobacteria bacterium]